MRRLLIVLGVLVLLALAVAGGGLYAIGRYNAPGPLAELQPVVVPHGTPAELAQALSAAGVINGTWAFRLAAALTAHEGQLRAGEFIFPAHGSLFATLTILRRGREVHAPDARVEGRHMGEPTPFGMQEIARPPPLPGQRTGDGEDPA